MIPVCPPLCMLVYLSAKMSTTWMQSRIVFCTHINDYTGDKDKDIPELKGP